NFNSDLSKWDVSNVENMSSMFEGCKNFNGDLSKWGIK
ncbi:BspA family leucine-rich repeat surface protein, partial [Campylobacter jejuni]